jgi:hypothetical protein
MYAPARRSGEGAEQGRCFINRCIARRATLALQPAALALLHRDDWSEVLEVGSWGNPDI